MKKTVNYAEQTEHLTAFVDLMGFREALKEPGAPRLNSYVAVVKNTKEYLSKVSGKSDFTMSLVSDAIVIAAPWDSELNEGLQERLFHFFYAVAKLQFDLLLEGFPSRGGVALDWFYMDQSSIPKLPIIMGMALAKAYDLEQNAIYPRVIIEPNVFKVAAKQLSTNNREGCRSQLFSEISDIASKQLNIDEFEILYDPEARQRANSRFPFDAYSIAFPSLVASSDIKEDDLDKVFEVIKQGLWGDQKLVIKYRWLQDFFVQILSPRFDAKSKKFYDRIRWL